MKIVIASDIHGSAYFCEKFVSQAIAERPDCVVLLGDLLYHGPRNPLPKNYDTQKTAQLLNDLNIAVARLIWVKGNCDANVDQVMLNFQMTETAVIFAENVTFFATHGDKYCLDSLPSLGKSDVLLNGHFHVPMVEEFGNDNLYVNCGSVSIPKQDSPNCYIVFENGVFTWKNLDGVPFKTHSIN